MLSQPACLGVWWNSSPRRMRPAPLAQGRFDKVRLRYGREIVEDDTDFLGQRFKNGSSGPDNIQRVLEQRTSAPSTESKVLTVFRYSFEHSRAIEQSFGDRAKTIAYMMWDSFFPLAFATRLSNSIFNAERLLIGLMDYNRDQSGSDSVHSHKSSLQRRHMRQVGLRLLDLALVARNSGFKPVTFPAQCENDNRFTH